MFTSVCDKIQHVCGIVKILIINNKKQTIVNDYNTFPEKLLRINLLNYKKSDQCEYSG